MRPKVIHYAAPTQIRATPDRPVACVWLTTSEKYRGYAPSWSTDISEVTCPKCIEAAADETARALVPTVIHARSPTDLTGYGICGSLLGRYPASILLSNVTCPECLELELG